jgi:hypothetical protein
MVLLFLTMAMDDNFLQDKTAAALATAYGLPNRPACLLPAAPPPPPSATAAVLELAVSSSSTTQHSWAKWRKSARNQIKNSDKLTDYTYACYSLTSFECYKIQSTPINSNSSIDSKILKAIARKF